MASLSFVGHIQPLDRGYTDVYTATTPSKYCIVVLCYIIMASLSFVGHIQPLDRGYTDVYTATTPSKYCIVVLCYIIMASLSFVGHIQPLDRGYTDVYTVHSYAGSSLLREVSSVFRTSGKLHHGSDTALPSPPFSGGHQTWTTSL